MKDLVEAKSAPRPAEPSGAQKARSTRGKDVWQRKGLAENSHPSRSLLWVKESKLESREEQRLRASPSEDELQYTRRRVAGSTRRVKYFIGTVQMSCGKIAEVRTLRCARMGGKGENFEKRGSEERWRKRESGKHWKRKDGGRVKRLRVEPG
jgi:hypothetical protein